MRVTLDDLLSSEDLPNPEAIRVVAGSPAIEVPGPLGKVLTEFPIYWVEKRTLDIREADCEDSAGPDSISMRPDVTIAIVR